MMQLGKLVDIQRQEDRRKERVGGMKNLKRQSKKKKKKQRIYLNEKNQQSYETHKEAKAS